MALRTLTRRPDPFREDSERHAVLDEPAPFYLAHGAPRQMQSEANTYD